MTSTFGWMAPGPPSLAIGGQLDLLERVNLEGPLQIKARCRGRSLPPRRFRSTTCS